MSKKKSYYQMPNWSEYWSDASVTSSDEEDDEEEEEIYCPRELDYCALEDFLELKPPPPVIEYLKNIGVVQLRECIRGAPGSIESVVNFIDTYGWKSFWQGRRSEPVSNRKYFSYEDWDAIGEYCCSLCDCVGIVADLHTIKGVMINVLKYGNFKRMNY